MHVAGPGSERCGFREAHGRMAGEAFLPPAAPEMGWEESLGFPPSRDGCECAARNREEAEDAGRDHA